MKQILTFALFIELDNMVKTCTVFPIFFCNSKHSYAVVVIQKSLFLKYIITAECILPNPWYPSLSIIKIYYTLNKYKCFL